VNRPSRRPREILRRRYGRPKARALIVERSIPGTVVGLPEGREGKEGGHGPLHDQVAGKRKAVLITQFDILLSVSCSSVFKAELMKKGFYLTICLP